MRGGVYETELEPERLRMGRIGEEVREFEDKKEKNEKAKSPTPQDELENDDEDDEETTAVSKGCSWWKDGSRL